MRHFAPRNQTWYFNPSDFPKTGRLWEQLKFLVRYAVLAPSTKNTQPWVFSVGEDEIRVFVDKRRWQKVADADQRELHLSVGCALENLLVAAEHFRLDHQVTYFPDPEDEDLVARVHFSPGGTPSPFRDPMLFPAIQVRHTNHGIYKSFPISKADLEALSACCVEPGISIYLTEHKDTKQKVDDLITQADVVEFANPAFREELGYWIGQGVFGTTWLISQLGQLAMTHLNYGRSTAQKDSTLLMSAPVLGLVNSASNDRTTQVQAGQVFERICLHATSLGLSIHPMSQILHVPELKVELADLLSGAGTFPQQPFRLGYAEPEKMHTPRRALLEVLVEH